ncbi:hypothetical protein SKAU_G00008420 [Synaphobranchus kaupii]|uniref:Beta-microseminoprotein n=1 Tax=Synaphobranchus kaupii TaxID=118154 RepID=A0A9Q1GAP7_SYNKA|nr:hypothetical protein SKAU_G00008420 [Synaphobranchus kaupii]
MKCLALALLLCTQLHLLHGGCHNPVMKTDGTHCQDAVDKTWHAIGSKWRNSACQDCTCTGCCDGYFTPNRFPDDCMKEFDNEKCEYKVFKKTDPTQPCPFFGGVGK